MKKLKPISIIILISVITFIMSYFGRYYWIPDLFSNFRMYYFFLFIVFAFYLFLSKKHIKATLISLLILLIIIEIYPFYKSINKEKSGHSLKIGSINLLRSNEDYKTFENFIKSENFDLFVVYELTLRWKNEINEITTQYPYKKTIIREDFFGIGIYSKIPLTTVKNKYFNELEIPSIIADFNYNNKPITIIGTHPQPPDSYSGYKSRNAHYENMNKFVKQSKKNIIITGDYNCTSFSANLSRLTKGTNLVDTRIGFGMQNTWNAKSFIFSIPIDHCFVTDSFDVIDRKVGPYIGSDHYPIIIELNIK